MYWAVLRQFIATWTLTVAILLNPGLGLALGWHYAVLATLG